MDEGTASKTELLWARLLVKISSNVKPASMGDSTDGDGGFSSKQ